MLDDEGRLVAADGAWWQRSGRQVFDAAGFYLPVRAIDAFGAAHELEYDALGRVTSGVTPDGSETLSTYNEAGLLESVAVRIRGASTPTGFVSDIDYDAKGQRQRCVHGNGTVTTYGYDPRTLRLTRLRLVRDADAAVLQDRKPATNRLPSDR